MQAQWYLFPLQFIAMLFAYLGYRKTGITLMFIALIFGVICFKSHMTTSLSINL